MTKKPAQPSFIPAHLLGFIADQLRIRINPKSFEDYAQRDKTRREHLAELQASVSEKQISQNETGYFYLCVSLGKLVIADTGHESRKLARTLIVLKMVASG